MKTTIAASMVLTFAGFATIGASGGPAELDPSLRIIRSHDHVTLADTLPALVLDHDGILLTWDESSE